MYDTAFDSSESAGHRWWVVKHDDVAESDIQQTIAHMYINSEYDRLHA